MRRRALRGALVTVLGQGAGQAFRIVSNLVLTRLLAPDAFGVMAIVYLVINGLTLISDVGIRPAIVRHERGEDPAFLDTAWTISVLRGLALWAAAAALALPLARFYAIPSLALLIPAAGVVSFIGGFEATKLTTLMRSVALGRRVAIELAAQAIAFAAMLGAAWIAASVWVLVVGAVVGVAARVALSFVAVPGRGNRLRWDRAAADQIRSFGRWIFVSSLFTFLAMRMDVAVLGRLVPPDVLGVYSIGITVVVVLRDVLGRVLSSVLMPVLADAHRGGFSAFAVRHAQSQAVLLQGGVLVVATAAVASPPFFALLYDPRYAAAGWISQLALVALWFSLLQSRAQRASEALGDSRSVAFSEGAKTLATAAGCIAGWTLAGLPGLIVGSALGNLVGWALAAARLRAHGVSVFSADVRYTLLGAAVAGVACGLPALLGARALGRPPTVLEAAAFGVVALAPLALGAAARLHREWKRAAPRAPEPAAP
jgi:O-antigen/teichoic acid export membrane protein